MSFILQVASWLGAPEHWVGSDGIPTRLAEHLLISGVTAAAAILIALPLGVFFGHTGHGGFLAINVANLGRAMPSLALLALMLPVALSLKLGLGFWPTFFALVPLGIPPVLTNSYVAVRQVDPDVIEAARGMGYSQWQLLWQIELPLGLAVIVAGVRVAVVTTIGLVTVTGVIGQGGLGALILQGIQQFFATPLVIGAVLSIALAVILDGVLVAIQRRATPWTRKAL